MALAAGFTLEALAAREWDKGGTPYSDAVIPESLIRAADETRRQMHITGFATPMSQSNVWYVNDIFGHRATLQMLDRAIEIETQAAKG